MKLSGRILAWHVWGPEIQPQKQSQTKQKQKTNKQRTHYCKLSVSLAAANESTDILITVCGPMACTVEGLPV